MDQARHCAVLWFQEIVERELYRELGYCSVYQYAAVELEFSRTRTGNFLQLARKLEALPRQKKEMEKGPGWLSQGTGGHQGGQRDQRGPVGRGSQKEKPPGTPRHGETSPPNRQPEACHSPCPGRIVGRATKRPGDTRGHHTPRSRSTIARPARSPTSPPAAANPSSPRANSKISHATPASPNPGNPTRPPSRQVPAGGSSPATSPAATAAPTPRKSLSPSAAPATGWPMKPVAPKT